MMASPGLPGYGAIAIIALILLLSFKEVFSGSKRWGKAQNNCINMGIVPLLLSFAAIVVFKIVEIL